MNRRTTTSTGGKEEKTSRASADPERLHHGSGGSRNPVAIVQARMGSVRFPGKVMERVAGKPLLRLIIDRLHRVKGIAEVVVATSLLPQDSVIAEFCQDAEIAVFQGSEADVLDRYYSAARQFSADPILRITGDCPLIDPSLIEQLLDLYLGGNFDYVNIAAGAGAGSAYRFPDGLDAECFSFEALHRSWIEATHSLDREHVTSYIWRHNQVFRCGTLTNDENLSNLRWTVDHPSDLEVVRSIYAALGRDGQTFGFKEILDYVRANPEIANLNSRFIGTEGHEALWALPKRDDK